LIGVFDFEVEGQVSGVPQDEVLVAVLERVQPLVSDTVDAAPGIGLVDAPDTFPIGTTVLSVEATDQSGNSATAQTSIIVVRSVQQPFFVSTGADFEVNAFDVLTFDIAVENPDALDYKITSADMPSGAKLEGLTFKWLPKNADAGQLSISFALEVAGETVGEAFVATVTVGSVNRSPKLADIANGKVDLVDPTVEIAVSAFDPDPDSVLEFTVVRIGSRGVLPVIKDVVSSEEDGGTRVNAVLEWTPDAVSDLDRIVKFKVTVTDGELIGSTQFSYGVGSVNNPPQLNWVLPINSPSVTVTLNLTIRSRSDTASGVHSSTAFTRVPPSSSLETTSLITGRTPREPILTTVNSRTESGSGSKAETAISTVGSTKSTLPLAISASLGLRLTEPTVTVATNASPTVSPATSSAKLIES
jgi:hypothetical protein